MTSSRPKPKTKTVQIRITESEYEHLKKLAEREGVTISQAARSVLFGRYKRDVVERRLDAIERKIDSIQNGK